MLFRLQRVWPRGKLSALVAFCYLCLSVLLPLQHTHHLASPVVPTQISAARQRVVHSHQQIAQQQARTGLHRQDRCLACDWQAMQVSVALPAFTLVLTPPQATRVVTTFPRYLRLLTFPASSRAPPLA